MEHSTMADAKTRMEKAKEEFEQAKKNFNAASGDILRARVAELKAEHPTIVKIGFDASYEYDDEGSYNWYVSPTVEFTEDETIEHSYERDEYPLMEGTYRRDYSATPTKETVTYTTGLEDLVRDDPVLDGFDIDAWMAVCGLDIDRDNPESGGWIED